MPRKIIGIPAFRSSDKKSFGCGIAHLEFVNKFGEPFLIMPWMNTQKVDMLYLPGGADLNPTAYEEIPTFACGDQDVHKQFFYDKRLDGYIEAGIPIFGVCLGFQMLCAKFGCKITQDLLWHDTSQNRWETAHAVRIAGTKTTFKVNSHHHQGVKLADFDQEILQALTIYNDTGDGEIVEAMRHRKLPIVGVQWHPEELYDPFTEKLIDELLK